MLTSRAVIAGTPVKGAETEVTIWATEAHGMPCRSTCACCGGECSATDAGAPLASLLQKPIDDVPRVGFGAATERGGRRSLHILALRPLLHQGWFRFACGSGDEIAAQSVGSGRRLSIRCHPGLRSSLRSPDREAGMIAAAADEDVHEADDEQETQVSRGPSHRRGR